MSSILSPKPFRDDALSDCIEGTRFLAASYRFCLEVESAFAL